MASQKSTVRRSRSKSVSSAAPKQKKPKKITRPAGRPRKFHPNGPEAKLFLSKVSDGVRLKRAMRDAGLSWNTLARWITEDDHGFEGRYARARKESGYSFEDRATKEIERAKPESAHLAKIRDDHYRWRAKMANPKKFGEKVDVTSDGEALKQPMAMTIQFVGADGSAVKP